MERWFEFLFHASVGLSLFFILYWLLLRQSTHFNANRFFLISSIILALVVAAFPFHYEIARPAAAQFNLQEFADAFNKTNAMGNTGSPKEESTDWILILLVVYLSGLSFFSFRLLIQTWKPLQIIRCSKSKKQAGYFIHENDRYALPFSFFNHIFINPKYHKQEELNAILVHEQVHIHERHWIDLIFIELLTVIFWFNPFIWLF